VEVRSLPIYQVDAFTQTVFRGNPAAVCPLEGWPADGTLQAIAAENNLSETAFFVSEGETYRQRWFTPRKEVSLCGHATLAWAFVLLTELGHVAEVARFETLSSPLDASLATIAAAMLVPPDLLPDDAVARARSTLGSIGARPLLARLESVAGAEVGAPSA
jgi:predicted PhzF superfamily epimerase YddE/YHI9